jgi:hypothetical protein
VIFSHADAIRESVWVLARLRVPSELPTGSVPKVTGRQLPR